jgi:hypothetical protein
MKRMLLPGATAALLLWAVAGCLMYMAEEFVPAQDAEELASPRASSAALITLLWNPPSGDPPVAYRVFFRIHGTADWVQLGEIPASPDPQYTVQHSTLGNGEYDFGVLAVYDSAQSSLHTSLDPSAEPTTGWYLKWQR